MCMYFRFLFEGTEGTVLYTGDFRWEGNEVTRVPWFKSGDRYVIILVVLSYVHSFDIKIFRLPPFFLMIEIFMSKTFNTNQVHVKKN